MLVQSILINGTPQATFVCEDPVTGPLREAGSAVPDIPVRPRAGEDPFCLPCLAPVEARAKRATAAPVRDPAQRSLTVPTSIF